MSQRLDAASDGLLQIGGRVRLSEADGRLHRRQQILGAVLSFPGEHDNLFVTPLTLRNVARRFRSADDFAGGILHRRNRH